LLPIGSIIRAANRGDRKPGVRHPCASPSHPRCGHAMSEASVVKARFVEGTVSPIGTDRHPMPQPEPLLPPDVRRVSASLAIPRYTPDGVDQAIKARYWSSVDTLMAQGANRITLAGLPIASQLGRSRVLALAEETARKTGVVADSHAEATIAA